MLIGLAGALLLALGLLTWRYQVQAERVGELEQSNTQLQQAVIDQTVALMQQQSRAAETDRLLLAVQQDKQQARRQMAGLRQELTEALADESCADTELPDVVVERLRFPQGNRYHAGDTRAATAAAD
ncbi:MAG: DUF2570 family protein [Motiliproteus sp.]